MPTNTTYAAGTVEPGWTTTEFYQTLLTQLVAVAIAVETLAKSGWKVDGLQAIVPAVAVAAATIAQIAYSVSRSKVKAAASAAALGTSAAAATGAADKTIAAATTAPKAARTQAPANGSSVTGADAPTVVAEASPPVTTAPLQQGISLVIPRELTNVTIGVSTKPADPSDSPVVTFPAAVGLNGSLRSSQS